MAEFINRHPALSHFVLAFLLGTFPLILVVMEVAPTGFAQMGALSASLAAFLLAGLEGGRKSIIALLRRALIWRVGFGWWLVAVLYLAPVALIALIISALSGNAFFEPSSLRPLYTVLPMMIVLIVLAGLGEEWGWRGYLLPKLQQRHNALISSLIVGVFHSLWHIPLFMVEGTAQYGWAADVGFLSAFLGYALFVIAWAVQLTWVFNNTGGSVLMVAVVHGAGNAWIGGRRFLLGGWFLVRWNFVILLVCIVIVII